MRKRDEYFLGMAREIAENSKEKKRHGAIVTKSGNVVGLGFNKFRNHPDNVSPEHIKTDCSYHAEAVAIRHAGGNARGATLYVARINKGGFDRYSEPCDNCKQVIETAGIKRVVYTESGEYNVG